MNKFFYSSDDFKKLRDRINKELKRRSTFKYWDPLVQPTIGHDLSSPLSLPDIGERTPVTDLTYTINESSFGSIEETNNILHPAGGVNPEGNSSTSSGAKFDYKEAKNFLVGLAKIHDINLFYGRDEKPGLAFRDYHEIEKVVKMAEDSVRSEKVGEIPSGEKDGEELDSEIGPRYFFDDYGAPEGISDYNPYNPHISEGTDRSINNDESEHYGGVLSSSYGSNPRNPSYKKSYKNKDRMQGVDGACNVACTGLCFLTCDDICSESCTSTCFGSCGTGCSSSCGNECSGCSSQCFNTCKTKCENATGYACMTNGAETVRIESTGGVNGIDAENHITYTTRSCNGCSYSCQFYPNKKTSCWDSACMGMCFISCMNACSESCYGGCINNKSNYNENSYKTGIGKGCSSNCTVNCVGRCYGNCSGLCTETCHKACKETCRDNCTWTCDTNCGNGCTTGCRNGCGGCTSCENYCTQLASHYGCTGCGTLGGCTSTCKMGCDKNCVGEGCRSICGTESAGACEANCRLSCMNSSCTALCSNACVSFCTTCVNTCGFQCGACSSACSVGCTQECNITCTEHCRHSCAINCVQSCTDNCGGCTNLCYSCTGFCIGVCSFKCQNGCSIACTGTCQGGCDEFCTKTCFMDCNSRCISNCDGSCATFIKADTSYTDGATYDPTSENYICPHPMDRIEERESLVIIRKPKKSSTSGSNWIEPLITIEIDRDANEFIFKPDNLIYTIYQTSTTGGIYTINETTGEVIINYDIINELVPVIQPNLEDNLQNVFVIKISKIQEFQFTKKDIFVLLPFWFSYLPIIETQTDFIIIIKTDREVLIDSETFNID
jgi:hypothetical protein